MKRTFVRMLMVPGFIVLGTWGLLRHLGAQQSNLLPSEEEQQHVLEVFGRHAEELEKTPDVLGLFPSPGTRKIFIITDRPAMVPTQVEDVPVGIKLPPPHLPPPPGVILLKPRGVDPARSEEDVLPLQEAHPEMEACPPGYREMRRYRWRFCNPENNLQILPAPMALPIAGIPHAEAEAIYNRHAEALGKLEGVTSVGLGADGITVSTSRPELVPGDVEGLPVKTVPPRRFRHTNHTSNSKTTPFHGGTAISDLVFGFGTSGGIALSQGKPWLIDVTHGFDACDQFANCLAGTVPLNECQHYNTASSFYQSPNSNPERISWTSR